MCVCVFVINAELSESRSNTEFGNIVGQQSLGYFNETYILQLLVSGGVDSSVCAALLRRALYPNQIIAVHVDNGMKYKR